MEYNTKVKKLSSVVRKKPEANEIYLYEKNCIFCGETEDTREFKGKFICSNCIDHVSAELNLSIN